MLDQMPAETPGPGVEGREGEKWRTVGRERGSWRRRGRLRGSRSRGSPEGEFGGAAGSASRVGWEIGRGGGGVGYDGSPNQNVLFSFGRKNSGPVGGK